MLHYVLQPRRHQHEGRIAVREGPDDPRPPPDLAVDALNPVVRPDPAPVLGLEFRVGQRLGEPVAHRPRGRPAELRHTEIDFPGARDESSRLAAAAVGLPACRPFIALGPDKLGRLFFGQRVEDPSSIDAMFADSARASFVDDLLFSRQKSYDDAWTVFLCVVVNLRKKLCVTVWFDMGMANMRQRREAVRSQ